MWYPAKVTVDPAAEPVTLAEAKANCGITGTDRDNAITLLIAASRSFVEKYCGICLVEQTVEVECDDWSDFRRLSFAPIISITSIDYVDTAGEDQIVDAAVYVARDDGLSPKIELAYGHRWPAKQMGSRIKVTAVVGYESVPADIKNALLLTISKHASLSGRDAAVRAETVEGVGSTQWGSLDAAATQLDSAAATLLENYRMWPL